MTIISQCAELIMGSFVQLDSGFVLATIGALVSGSLSGEQASCEERHAQRSMIMHSAITCCRYAIIRMTQSIERI